MLLFLNTFAILYGLLLPFSITNIDSYIIYDLAKDLQRLNLDQICSFLKNNTYLNYYPHQFGLLFLNYTLISLFKEGAELAFTILNILSTYLTSLSLFFITKKLFHSNRALMLFVILQSLFVMPFLSINYHYGWQIGLALSALSLLFYILYKDKENKIYLLSCLLSLIIATFIKPNFIILGLAYVCFEFSCLLFKPNLKKILVIIFFILSTAIAGNLSKFTYNFISQSNHGGIPQVSYLAMGLQSGELGNGWYNGYHVMLYDKYDGNTELIKQESLDFIKNTITDYMDSPIGAIHFFKDKWDSFMLIKDYNLHSYYSYVFDTIPIFHNDIADNVLFLINNVSFYLNMIGISYLIIKTIMKNDFLSLFNVILICFIGSCTYHLLFEAKGIYIYPWINIILPLSSFGLDQIITHSEKRVKYEEKKTYI